MTTFWKQIPQNRYLWKLPQEELFFFVRIEKEEFGVREFVEAVREALFHDIDHPVVVGLAPEILFVVDTVSTLVSRHQCFMGQSVF